ncbi:MAG: GTPase Era [Clostridia bacterium]|jgi:GTP-binding protein Era|nr:GTPase Era [Clostridia bacterium]
MSKFKSGFVTFVGRTNVGKSTLMNNLIGEKIAIMSDKPQTTRNKINCVYTDADKQIVFVDTPGVHKPKTKLSDKMLKDVSSAMGGVDIILFLVEPDKEIGPGDKFIIESLKNTNKPVFLIINKIDTLKDREELLEIIVNYKNLYDFEEIIPISALKGDNTEVIIDEITKRLEEGPMYFPEDMVTDQPERQIVAELIREKALHLLSDEIPHGVAVVIESMKRRGSRNIVDIEAVIYCERKSHKGMIIGKQGNMLKSIGSNSRIEIEGLLGSKVFLQLWVKVKKEWRDSEFYLKNFGYTDDEM